MRLAMNSAEMPREGLSCAAIDEMEYLIKAPRTEVRKDMKRVVAYPRQKKVKAVIQRHPAMFCHNQTSICLPCQNGTAKNPQTPWRLKGTGSPPPPDPECRLQSRLHLLPTRDPPQPVTLLELNCLKSSICQPDIRIGIQLFPVRR
jgi:hypothetical protein